MLVKDKIYTGRIISRYRELRKTILSDEYLTGYMDEDNKLSSDERNPRTYEEAVIQMKDRLQQRLAWLDENLEILRQYSHESAIKKFNH